MTAEGTFQLRSGKITRTVRGIVTYGGLALAINFGCTDHLPVEASFDVLETPMTVTGAEPAEGEQGEALEVRIFGTGFEDDAVAAWERDGVADPGIDVVQTVFVSSTELRAAITIAFDAELGIRDISVSSDRKKGIGSENPTAVGQDLFAVSEYVTQGLGLWSGMGSRAIGINNDGVVVGVGSEHAPGRTIAVYWTAASGMAAILDTGSVTAGINNRSWIIGRSPAGGFIFEGGHLTHLERRGPYEVLPTAINDSGTIVGIAIDVYPWIIPNRGPVVLRRLPPSVSGRGLPGLPGLSRYGSPIPLPLRDGDDIAVPAGINNNGDIAGYFIRIGDGFEYGRAVLWKARPDGTYEDPLVLGGGEGGATGINDAGWIVGSLRAGYYSITEGRQMKAVLWHPDDYNNPILLQGAGGVETHASAINNHGQIAGERRDLWWIPPRSGCCDTNNGVLWEVDPNGRAISTTLLRPSQGHDIMRVHGINDAGWIVGTSSRSSGPASHEATLWRPR